MASSMVIIAPVDATPYTLGGSSDGLSCSLRESSMYIAFISASRADQGLFPFAESLSETNKKYLESVRLARPRRCTKETKFFGASKQMT